MSTSFVDGIQRRAFVHWLRTGQRLDLNGSEIELKFNPWHDPEDGRFTHAGTGSYFGPGGGQSAESPANRERRVADGSSGKVVSRNPVNKVAEFAAGLRQSTYDAGKEAVTELYEIVTTNPVTTARHFGEGLAKTVDSVIAAEDTPARVQVRRAANAVANASARDLGYATGRVMTNVGLAAVPGAGAAKIYAVRKLRAARPGETFDPPNMGWRKETLEDGPAKAYNDSAKGARPGQAPTLMRTNAKENECEEHKSEDRQAMIAIQIARLIANYSLFLDQTDEDFLDPDAAVDAMEVLAADLQALDKPFLRELIDAFAVIAQEYSGEAEQLVRDIPFGYFLEEELAADDPVKLAELDALRDARP